MVADRAEPAPAAGEVIVRVRTSSINPIDGAIAAGMLRTMVPHEYPIVLGRDFAGTVEQVGDGVTAVRTGDEVFGLVPFAAPAVQAGAWAEWIAVAETLVTKRPASVSLEVAGTAAFAASTAIAAVNAVGAANGDVTLVVGASGGVGNIAVQLLHAAGATVIAPAIDEDEAYLKRLGVDQVVPREGDVLAAVRDLHPDGVDAIIDLVSWTPGAYDGALREGAPVCSTLQAAGEGPGRFNVGHDPTAIGQVAELLAQGRFEVPISRAYELDDAVTALADHGSKHTQGKLLIRVG